MCITKMFFLSIERNNGVQLLNMASILLLILVLIIGSYSYIKILLKQKEKPINRVSNINLLSKILLIITLLGLGCSFYINYHTKVLIWDSVALYDARAKFLLRGFNFSQMVDLSKYDPKNSYYYLLYPPFTSIIHYFWNKFAIPAPVNIYYSVNLLILGICVYLFAQKKIGRSSAIFLTFLTIINDVIFSGSLSGYTNLPFTLYIFVGVLLLSEYVEDKRLWKLLYGLALVISSQWIRFLEPLWFGVILSLLIVKLKDRKKITIIFLLTPLLALFYGFVEYTSWSKFVSSFGDKTKIVSYSSVNIIEPIVGVFTGSFYTVLLQFVKYWGVMLLVYLLSTLFLEKKPNDFKKNNLSNQKLLLRLTILFSIVIYFGGLYFVSFQTDWWNKLGDSLVRSSSFLIPISGYLLLKNLSVKK